MRKIRFLIGFMLILAMICNVGFAAPEILYQGSKTPYPYEKTEYTAAPAGYQSAFIYVAGRHGSRHLSNYKYDKAWLELLTEAEKSGQITEMGQNLKAEVQRMIAFEQGKYAELTIMGKRELFEIGKRSGENFKSLYATNKPIFADATHVIRAQQSRDNFLEGLKSTGYKGEITSIFYEGKKDPYLRPYDIATKYLAYESKGQWKKDVANFAKNDTAKAMAERIFLQLVSPEFLARLNSGELKFTDAKNKTIIKNASTAISALYELYVIGPSLREDGLKDVDIKKYFTNEELQMFERIQVAREYYLQGPGAPDANNISTNIMAPLVKRMIVEVDTALAKKDKIGVFSFAHAETELPLVSFLEIGNSHIQYPTTEEAVQKWNTADFGPMAGNVQWIVYTAKGKEPLVKMLLNEKEVAFAKALKPVYGPYYKWADVKGYYTKKVESLGISLNSSIEDNRQSLIEKF